jgi:hypothetical protein
LWGPGAAASLRTVRGTRTSLAALFLALALPLAGCLLWMLHADAWGLGGRSPVLNYDSAQYALAARELATHGRLATTFALPLELTRHAAPPWPLAVVQPGLVLAEAALFRMVPQAIRLGGVTFMNLSRPDEREWLALVLPFCCFILIGLLLAVVASRLLFRHAPKLAEGWRLTAALTVGLAFYLDPEAQHFATGGFTEGPFTLGLLLALAALALGEAPRRPLLFGLLLGVTGTLRANMLWLAPVLALGAMLLAPRGRRLRVLTFVLLGYAAPLAPWWLYKWREFGSPAWDLTRFVVWDGVQGRTWFSLYHLPELPVLPAGPDAVRLLAAKTAANLPRLLLDVFTGPRALWLGAIALWIVMAWPRRSAGGDVLGGSARPPGAGRSQGLAEPGEEERGAAGSEAERARGAAQRISPGAGPAPGTLRDNDLRPPAVAALAVLVVFALGVLTAAASIPWLRFVFPARVLLEAAGLMALWAVLSSAPDLASRPLLRRALAVAAGLLALGWGSMQTARGNAEARVASTERGVPGVLSLLQIAVLMNREIPAGEVVMSNLGPMLAWHARRPVLHLSLSPADLEGCRRRLEFRHVLLVFRDPANAWPEWREAVAAPAEAPNRPEWNVRRVREWRTADGFSVIWLELKPPRAQLAVARWPGAR